METVPEDEEIDCLFNVIWTCPFEGSLEKYLRFYEGIRGCCQKTMATWLSGLRLPLIHDMSSRLEDLGNPVFSDHEMAIKALGIASQYATRKKG